VLRSLIFVTTTFSADFWATLAAGIIGFLGSLGGVTLQRRYERQESTRESKRQRKEIAKALICEIEGIDGHYLGPLEESLAGYKFGGEHAVHLKNPPADPFPVFHANASRIGEFDEAEVTALIGFYNFAGNFMATLVDAEKAKQSLQTAGDMKRAQSATQELYHALREMIPSIIGLARETVATLNKRITAT